MELQELINRIERYGKGDKEGDNGSNKEDNNINIVHISKDINELDNESNNKDNNKPEQPDNDIIESFIIKRAISPGNFKLKHTINKQPGKSPNVKNKYGKLLVKLYPWEVVFGVLSSEFCRLPVKHNIDGLLPAPSIEQWYQQLLLDAQDTHDILNDVDKQFLFERINKNFEIIASDNYDNFKRRCAGKPVGFLTSSGIVTLKEARRLYCLEYEQQLLNDSETLETFKLLHELITTTNKDVIIASHHTGSINGNNLINIYKSGRSHFTVSHILIDMIINYPDFDKCSWHLA